MVILRIFVGLVLAYVVLVILAWRFQERLAFPAPRAPLPDPQRVGVANGEKIEVTMEDGTRLVGWYLASTIFDQPPQPSQPAAGLLWFYGNGETIAAIGPIVREFQPPGTALLVVDYPGYGGSGGRRTGAGLYGRGGAGRAGPDPWRWAHRHLRRRRAGVPGEGLGVRGAKIGRQRAAKGGKGRQEIGARCRPLPPLPPLAALLDHHHLIDPVPLPVEVTLRVVERAQHR